MNRPNFHIDYTITIGNIIVLISMSVALIAAFYHQDNRIETLELMQEEHKQMMQATNNEIRGYRRDQRDYYLSKDVAERLIDQLTRIENRLERIEERNNN